MKLAAYLDTRGVTANGFDTIRLIAAFMVLVSHAFALTTGDSANEPLRAFSNGAVTLGYLSVGCFFSLSGVLITQSFVRSSTLSSFARKRAARILPGLWASLVLTVLGLSLVSSLPFAEYIRNPQTWSFFAWNASLLKPAFVLPGVFEDLPLGRIVNGSLWTLRQEVICYAVVVFLGLAAARFRLLTLALTIACTLLIAFEPPVHETLLVWARLFRFFGMGMLLFHYRERVPIDWRLSAACAVLLTAALPTPFGVHVAPPLLAYLVISVGLLAPRWFGGITRRGDISYGVYIYAFPVQQLLVPMSNEWALPWLGNILLSTLPVLALATLSWIWVERPARDWNQRLKIGGKPPRSAPTSEVEAEPGRT